MSTSNKYRGIVGRKPRDARKELVEYASQGLTAAGIMTLSDLVGQAIVSRGWSLFSPLAMGVYGFVTGIMCYTMYQRMESPGEKHLHARDRAKLAVYKMCVDQFIWSPVSTFAFILYTSIIDATSRTTKEVLYLYFSVLLRSYRVWPIIQLVNFLFVPPKLRVPFMSTIALVWNVYVKMLRSTK